MDGSSGGSTSPSLSFTEVKNSVQRKSAMDKDSEIQYKLKGKTLYVFTQKLLHGSWVCETFETPSDVNKVPHCIVLKQGDYLQPIRCRRPNFTVFQNKLLIPKTFPKGESCARSSWRYELATLPLVCTRAIGRLEGRHPIGCRPLPAAKQCICGLFFWVIGSQESDQKLFLSNVTIHVFMKNVQPSTHTRTHTHSFFFYTWIPTYVC